MVASDLCACGRLIPSSCGASSGNWSVTHLAHVSVQMGDVWVPCACEWVVNTNQAKKNCYNINEG